jgi:hypothetical protein
MTGMVTCVVADAGEYHVTVCAPRDVAPDAIRLYRNRTRVLVMAEAGLWPGTTEAAGALLSGKMAGTFRYGVDLTLHASDMLEAAMADGSKVELVTVRRPPPVGTPIRETVTFTGEAPKPTPPKDTEDVRPLRG